MRFASNIAIVSLSIHSSFKNLVLQSLKTTGYIAPHVTGAANRCCLTRRFGV